MSEFTPQSSLPTGKDIALPWHLQLPKSLEKEFRIFFRASVARIAPQALLLVIALISMSFFVEGMASDDVLAISWRPRLFTLMLSVGFFLLCRHPRWQEFLHIGAVGFALAISLTGNYLGYAVHHPQSYIFFLHTPLAIVLIGILIQVPFFMSLASAIAMIAIMSGVLLLDPQRTDFEGLTLILVTCAFAIMSLFAQYIHEKLLRQHFLSENVLHQHRDELHSANLILENQATVDGMTGCINRRGMETRLEKLFHAMEQGGANAPERITLLLFDIDFFKQYNDTYGHPVGDEVLRQVSKAFRDELRTLRAAWNAQLASNPSYRMRLCSFGPRPCGRQQTRTCPLHVRCLVLS